MFGKVGNGRRLLFRASAVVVRASAVVVGAPAVVVRASALGGL